MLQEIQDTSIKKNKQIIGCKEQEKEILGEIKGREG